MVRRSLWLIGSACCVLLAATGHAQNLNFLKTAPIRQFTDEDVTLMMNNADEVLAAQEPAAKREWSNPKTGASGAAEIKGVFVGSDGAPCKRLRVVNKAKNKTDASDVTYTLCKHDERGWLLNTQAKPAGKKD